MLVLVKKDGLALEWATETLKADREVVLTAVSKGAFALEYASDKLKRDRLFVLEAVQSNGYALACAPKFQNDREIVETAVREDGSSLEYASESLRRNREIALIAAKSDSALEHIDEVLWKDRNFACSALAQNDAAIEFLTSTDLADRNFLLDAIALNPKVLPRYASHVSHTSHTLEADFLVQALRRNPKCFSICSKPQFTSFSTFPIFTPDILVGALSIELLKELQNHAPELLDRDFLCSAVEVMPEALFYAAANLKKDADLVKILSCRRASTLQYADVELRSNQKFLQNLIDLNPACLRFCSKELLYDHDFNLKALQQNSLSQDHIDPSLWHDTSFVLKALAVSETVLEKVAIELPELMGDIDFAFQALQICGKALEFLSEDVKEDVNLVTVALEDEPQALAFASSSLQDNHRLVLNALKKDGSVLSHAGESIKDNVAMVIEATKATPCAFQFASERIRKDQDVVWNLLKISPEVLAFSLLAGDGNFVLSAAIHYEAAVQYAAEAGSGRECKKSDLISVSQVWQHGGTVHCAMLLSLDIFTNFCIFQSFHIKNVLFWWSFWSLRRCWGIWVSACRRWRRTPRSSPFCPTSFEHRRPSCRIESQYRRVVLCKLPGCVGEKNIYLYLYKNMCAILNVCVG